MMITVTVIANSGGSWQTEDGGVGCGVLVCVWGGGGGGGVNESNMFGTAETPSNK